MTRRYAAKLGVSVLGLATSAPAAEPHHACPDGWFCDVPAPPEEPPESTPDGARGRGNAPDAPPAPEQPDLGLEPGVPDSSPEPTLGYELREDKPVESRFAVLGRIAWALIENGHSPASPLMGSAGLGLRVRPLTHLAVDFTVDSAFGSDYLDAARFETALGGAVVAFLNPGEHVQVYLNTGLFHSWARVTPEDASLRKYRYFGAFIGLGAEHPFHRHYAVSLDFTGFIRGRSDGAADTQPEFIDRQTGSTTNTSRGGLLRVGVLRYF